MQTTTVQCSTRTSVGRCAWVTFSESRGGLGHRDIDDQMYVRTLRRKRAVACTKSRSQSRSVPGERLAIVLLFLSRLYISTQLQPAALRSSFCVRAPPARPARIRVTGATGACSSAEARARDVVVANESSPVVAGGTGGMVPSSGEMFAMCARWAAVGGPFGAPPGRRRGIERRWRPSTRATPFAVVVARALLVYIIW